MKHLGNLAIIGTGASTIYLLHHIRCAAEILRPYIDSITLFERSGLAGCGMPYSPETTDRFNMSNISSEEIPTLPQTLYEWLDSQSARQLESWGIDKATLNESEVYPRLPLGQYLHAQYENIIRGLTESGITLHEVVSCEIADISERKKADGLRIADADGKLRNFDSVMISTGHSWKEEDRPDVGYFGSPWPIFKLLPAEGEFHNFTIGTLGASLSAFDVVSSLAHRHGTFSQTKDDRMVFTPHPGTENFKLTLHSMKGWLPHLQFDQDEPFREIYRHTDRKGLLALLDEDGYLRIATFFDKVCRPALSTAFEKDDMAEIVSLLKNPDFGLEDFIAKMSAGHDYNDAFAGMRKEMGDARESVLNHKPVHWKEVIDDLMYCLNYHAELMPAEDHITLRKTVMPFLLSVIAAMPLPSGEMILALHAAGKLDLVSGKVSIDEKREVPGQAAVTVEEDGKTRNISYGMFVDCSGQKPLELEDYPFPSLVETGAVSSARAVFCDPKAAEKMIDSGHGDKVVREGESYLLQTGGIEIDASYRVVGSDGQPNDHIYDIAFPHTSGIRPYSYGLQACSATAGIVVESWLRSIKTLTPVPGDPVATTPVYEEF